MRNVIIVYQRAAERGRMLPPGVTHIDSWVDADRLDRCFQLRPRPRLSAAGARHDA